MNCQQSTTHVLRNQMQNCSSRRVSSKCSTIGDSHFDLLSQALSLYSKGSICMGGALFFVFCPENEVSSLRPYEDNVSSAKFFSSLIDDLFK